MILLILWTFFLANPVSRRCKLCLENNNECKFESIDKQCEACLERSAECTGVVESGLDIASVGIYCSVDNETEGGVL